MTDPHSPPHARSAGNPAGPPPRRLIGVDVGGTKIAAGLVADDAYGTVLESLVRPTPAAQGPQAVLDAIADAVAQLPGHRDTFGVGIGTGGVIDRRRGTVLSANSLLPGWAGTDLRSELSDRLRLPVVADNDVNVFALAEQTYGAGADCSSVLYASVGTGVGGALTVDGRLLRGAHHTAGELGHIAVPEAAGRICNCGRAGHLEAVAAGPAIAARYRELAGDDGDTGLEEVAARARTHAAPSTGTGNTTGSAAGSGTRLAHLARTALAEGAAALGRTLAGLVNTVDPERVVIGGGVASIGDPYWRPLIADFTAELLPGPSAVRPVPAALGTRAAVTGAAALLIEDT